MDKEETNTKIIMMHQTAMYASRLNTQSKSKKFDRYINAFNEGEIKELKSGQHYSIVN